MRESSHKGKCIRLIRFVSYGQSWAAVQAAGRWNMHTFQIPLSKLFNQIDHLLFFILIVASKRVYPFVCSVAHQSSCELVHGQASLGMSNVYLWIVVSLFNEESSLRDCSSDFTSKHLFRHLKWGPSAWAFFGQFEVNDVQLWTFLRLHLKESSFELFRIPESGMLIEHPNFSYLKVSKWTWLIMLLLEESFLKKLSSNLRAMTDLKSETLNLPNYLNCLNCLNTHINCSQITLVTFQAAKRC